MKNKSSNHKSTNRFKFTTFAERVNTIDVRRTALYHLDHVNTEVPLENETFFYKAVQKWKVLNLTTEYVTFSKKVESIITLPQLLHRREDVVELLLEYLKNGNVLTIQPLLELVVVLARDLQEEFYVYFPRFLNCLIKLLNTKEPEQLEWTLICLAFIFKSLRVYLKRDISVVFDAVLPILSDSMPPYVSNFAAESFAFVARDIRDKRKFLQILIKSVNINKNAIIGCGRLLFEVVRGVANQFHSCAAQFLPFLFDTLGDKTLHQKTLFKVLTQTVTDMLEVIHPKNSEVFWNSILFTINTTLNKANETDDQTDLEYLLKLVGQALEYNSGIFLINPFPVLVLIVQLLDTKLPESIYKVTSQVGVLVLMCNHTNIPHEDAVSLVKKILGMPYPSLVLEFVEEVINCPSFDMIVLPHFISSIETFDRKIVKVLSKICLTKSPLCKSGIDMYSWVKYPIDLQNKTTAYGQVLFNSIDCDVSKVLKSPEECICALVCLPHIKNINTNHASQVQGKLLSELIKYLIQLSETADKATEDNISVTRNVLFMIATTMEALVHTVDSKIAEKYCSTETLIGALMPYICEAKYICSLRILDLFFTVCQREKILQLTSLQSLYEPLAKNLTSPFHEVRLLTTHICSIFEDMTPRTVTPKNKNAKRKSDQCSESFDENIPKKEKYEMFSLCYNVEASPLSMSDYRDQLVKISKMTFGSLQYDISDDDFYKKFGLKYVLGLLHVNFKLLWEPLQSFVIKYAQSMPAADFWGVFNPCLQNATKNAREAIAIPSAEDGFIGELTFLVSAYSEYYNISVKPDFSLYRIHLWQVLYQAPTLSESKNRDLTPLFLEFLKVEFEKPYEADVFIDDTANASIMDVDDSVLQDEDEELSEAEEKKVKISRATYDTLIAYFKVYTNIQNPKAMFMEDRLRKIYLDFLTHKNPIIQKIALDCFLRYKNKHLIPYKQNLYNLVDGKKFKDELRTFKMEADENSIRTDDRDELIPIILRIAYSKMITKTGVDKKGGTQLRRSLVMRFLAGCEESELIVFTNMAFGVFEKYLTLDVNIMIERIGETLGELLKVPPKKLVGALHLVDSMREQFTRPGQEVLLLRLLKVVICIGAFINGILADQHKLKRGYMSILKDIRNQCINSVARFFQQFESYEWSFDDHLLPIFNIFIWPVVEKLPMEGVHSPTPLLKLFNIWSQNPRYHSLFDVCQQSNEILTTLPFFFKLMNANKLHHTVSEMSVQILERLLTMEVEDGVNMINIPEQFVIRQNIETVEQLNLSENLNHGSVSLIRHIPVIVTILKDKLSNINHKKLQKRELIILARVTELVSQPDIVDSLLTFSLPILIHRVGHGAAEDTLEASLNALISLLNKATNPRQHVRLLAPLFSKVTPASSRRLLCKVLEVLAKDESSKLMASIIADMNASDEKWLEQPDFDKRLSAYKLIFKLSDEGGIDVELGAMIIHNCFFVIQRDTDISLRNTAVACLHRIIPKLLLTVKDSEKDFLLKDTVLLLIRNSLKANSETLTMEGISLLGELVRECSESHSVFKELLPVSNKYNKDIDFFENLQHLQFHRKIRALQRFCSMLKESKQVPSHKTLTQFIIPLASQFICSEKYTPKYALVDAAIETVGAVCQLLPWHQYEAVLKFYVGKIQRSSDYQKQLIKLVSIILDAFHFDLSKTDSIPELPISMPKPEVNEEKTEANEEKAAMTETGVDDELEIPLDGDDLFESNDVEQQPDRLPFERVVTLSPSAAKRVITTITEILTKLDWNSSQLLEHEAKHKKINSRMSNRREAEEKLKLPMALAVVKLLQKLPQPMLKNNILSVLIKVCTFLKSPMVGVRASARDIISKIMSALGTSQLGTLLWHLTTMLTRGIHVHVLISTVHMVLTTLKDGFGPGEMDKHLQNILKVCLNDLFGKASEEKLVVKLGSKAPEAKPSLKSFSTLRIIAQNISESNITNLLKPFKDIAESSHSKRTVLKIQNALQNISIGLMDNKYVSIGNLLTFLSEVFSDSIVNLKCGVQKRKKTDEREDRWNALRPDCMIIPANPRGKKGLITKVIRNSAQANAHVLIEFGLNVFHIILQKDKLVDDDFRVQVDLIVPFIIESLKSPQVKVVTLALKCITSLWAKKFDLPSMKSQIKHTSSSVFQILHKYATSGLSKKDDNFHLVANAFRAVTALIRDVKYHTINEDEMKALLLYAEHDIHDSERQATAFSLLKAIIVANYNVSEINDIIKKVADITILSESVRTREESRTVMLVFVMNCHVKKKIEQIIQFYITQLEYEMDHGRISAMKMIQTFIDKFTADVLSTHATLLYVSLGRRMVNEQTTDCRILLAECIELLLQRISIEKRNELFKINMALFADPKPIHTELAAQLTSRYVNVEKQNFKTRLSILLPELTVQLIGTQITTGRFVRINPDINNHRNSINDPSKDNSYIQVLNLLIKLCEMFPGMFSDADHQVHLDEMAARCHNLLAHSHSWVRFHSAKFLVSFLQSLNPVEYAKILKGVQESDRMVFHSTDSLKSLILDLCSQFIPGGITEDMAEVVCKDLLILIKMASELMDSRVIDQNDNEAEDLISEIWIIKKLRSSINGEVTKAPGTTVVRVSIFNMLEEVFSFLGKDKVFRSAKILMPCLVREITKTDATFDHLKIQANKIGTILSGSLGDIVYNDMLAKVQAIINSKRKDRKQKIAQDKINNPDKAAKRKLTLKDKKKDYKRKKFDILKGRLPNTRKVQSFAEPMDDF